MELPSLQGHTRPDSIPTVMSVHTSMLSEEWQQNCVSQGTDVVLDPSRSQSPVSDQLQVAAPDSYIAGSQGFLLYLCRGLKDVQTQQL